MTDFDHWQAANEQYLSAALSWLRLRLERLAPAPPTTFSLPLQAPAAPAVEDRPLRRTRKAQKPTAPAAPAVADRVPEHPAAGPPAAADDVRIAQAATEMSAREAIDPPPAALLLGQRFGLSRFELETLLLCAAMDLDTRIASLCAQAQGDPNRPYPTFALALTLFDDPAWDILSPERPLRYWRLVEIHQPTAQPLTTSSLRADERIVNYIKGLNYLDDRLAPLLAPLDMAEVALPPSQQSIAETIVRQLRAAMQPLPVIQLVGQDSPSKQMVSVRAAAELSLHVYRLPAGLLPAQAAELETLARLWQRESALLPIALYLDAHDTDGGSPDGQSPLNRFVARSHTLIFLDVRDVWPNLDRASVTIDVARPTPIEQQAAWNQALGSDGTGAAARLAGQFNLNLPEIEQIARSALPAGSSNGSSGPDRVWTTCLMRTRPRLDTLAQRIEARATWETLVLPDTETRTLKQIGAQVGQRGKVYDEWGFRRQMNRGLGISALFGGESGTGKTMAAEVIANDLRLNLYRIDLSAVVSKYIGETEKNLRRLFDAAEDGGAILFFDEADALFGKRSEVKDSHDRYANIEINYLLQRMEAYRGLAILATNLKSALDTAFMRRLRFIVNFPFPDQALRRQLWAKVYPPETPTENLDFERLARFNLTGGSIHNIAINAAFLAAQTGSKVTMPLILEAARAEFRKLDRPIMEAEFK
jgi:hypothetical protein